MKGRSIRLQADTVTQASSVLLKFPASPLGRSLRFLEMPKWLRVVSRHPFAYAHVQLTDI
jgi:hypothetical protein